MIRKVFAALLLLGSGVFALLGYEFMKRGERISGIDGHLIALAGFFVCLVGAFFLLRKKN